jgi:hypothetical protein
MKMHWMFGRILRKPEGGDDGAGSGGGGGGDASQGGNEAAGSQGDQGGAAAGDQGQGQGDNGSAFAAAGKGGKKDETGEGEQGEGKGGKQTPEQIALNAAEKDTRRPAHIPAKYWDHEKGEVRVEALAKSNSELEARMKSVGLPPKTADEYTYEPPEKFKAIVDAGFGMPADVSKAMRDRLLEAGFTKSQHGVAMDIYFENIEEVAEIGVNYGAQKRQAELMTYYKTPEATQQAVSNAMSVVHAFGDEQDIAGAMGPTGNVPPWVIRILDKVSREMGEDTAINDGAILSEQSIEELMRGGPGKDNSPYWNPNDPQHKQTVAKVQRHHEAMAAKRQRQA